MKATILFFVLAIWASTLVAADDEILSQLEQMDSLDLFDMEDSEQGLDLDVGLGFDGMADQYSRGRRRGRRGKGGYKIKKCRENEETDSTNSTVSQRSCKCPYYYNFKVKRIEPNDTVVFEQNSTDPNIGYPAPIICQTLLICPINTTVLNVSCSDFNLRSKPEFKKNDFLKFVTYFPNKTKEAVNVFTGDDLPQSFETPSGALFLRFGAFSNSRRYRKSRRPRVEEESFGRGYHRGGSGHHSTPDISDEFFGFKCTVECSEIPVVTDNSTMTGNSTATNSTRVLDSDLYYF